MIKRFNQKLKDSLTETEDNYKWNIMPNLVPISTHSTIKEDIDCCSAELVYETVLHLHDQFIFTVQAIFQQI